MLTERQCDALAEIVNIGFGEAAAFIADSLQKPATLVVPKVEVIAYEGLEEYLKTDTALTGMLYAANQRFIGNLDGESFFLITEPSASRLTACFLELADGGTPNQDDVNGSTLELVNILTSACIGRIAEMLGTSVVFSPPAITMQESVDAFRLGASRDFSKVIVVTTKLVLAEESITGCMYILMKDSSFSYLLEALETFMSSYGY